MTYYSQTVDKAREPDWDNDEIRNRKEGATNFVQCGWCEHASGSHRHGVCLSGSCSFISRANEHSVKYLKNLNEKVDWKDKCQLLSLDHYKIERLVRMWNRRIDSSKSLTKTLGKETEHLKELSSKAYVMPPTPDNRPYEYYNIGDRVAVTFAYRDKSADKSKQQDSLYEKYTYLLDTWMTATVTYGYRHHDGVVSYEIDKISESHGKSWGCGCSTPGIFTMNSVRHFVNYPEDYIRWRKNFMSEGWRSKPQWDIPEYTIKDWLLLLEVVE